MISAVLPWMICLLLLPGVFAVSAAQAETIDDVLKAYTQNAQEVHGWTMQALVELEILYTHQVNPEDKIDYENVFALPVEDTMYQQHQPLFSKIAASLDWKILMKPDSISGEQLIKNAYVHFTSVNPDTAIDKPENIKSMSPLPDHTYPFNLPNVGKQNKAEFLNIFMPEDLRSWHHFYSLWYPLPEQIGIPNDSSRIVMTQGDDTLFVMMYTPVQLDQNLLHYLALVSQKPNLTLSDLVCTLMVAPNTFNCKSVDIKLRDNPKQSLFTITSFSEAMAGSSIHIPTKVLLLTSLFNQTPEGIMQSTEYYCSARLKSFVKQ